MIEVLLKDSKTGLPLVLDVSAPTPEDYAQLCESYNLPSLLLDDCMDPMHLPKMEKIKEITFLLVRVYDELSVPTEDNVNAMTRKVAVFIGPNFLIFIHRKRTPFLTEVLAEFADTPISREDLQTILLDTLLAAIETYYEPLERAETRIHEYETSLFRNVRDTQNWEGIFTTKSRLMVIKRMLWHIFSSVQKYVPYAQEQMPAYQEVRERIESLQFFTDSLLDNLNNLLAIQISLASHSTNEVIRFLTIFSVVFMPLMFITGVYGMNFKHMPGLQSPYGFWILVAVMSGISVSIYLLFRRRGWLR